jgi:hypothetical protein
MVECLPNAYCQNFDDIQDFITGTSCIIGIISCSAKSVVLPFIVREINNIKMILPFI